MSTQRPTKRTKTIQSAKRSASGRKAGQVSSANQSWPYRTNRSYMIAWDPFPAKAVARMRYSTVISLNPGVGTPAHYLFRATSIHDPDYTGVGHQPYGHDTYASIYNHYRVKQCDISMQCTNIDRDGIFGIHIQDDLTTEPDYDTIREVKGSRMCITGSTANNNKVQHQYKEKMFGDNSQLTGSFGGNPSENMFFDCWAEASGPTGDPATINYIINITYLVEMWELKDLGQS